jgi:hypothetical protein
MTTFQGILPHHGEFVLSCEDERPAFAEEMTLLIKDAVR